MRRNERGDSTFASADRSSNVILHVRDQGDEYAFRTQSETASFEGELPAM